MLTCIVAVLLGASPVPQACGWQSAELARVADVESVYVSPEGRVYVVLRDIEAKRCVRVLRASDDGGKTWITVQRYPYDSRDDLLGASLLGAGDGTMLLAEFVVRDYSQFKPGAAPSHSLLVSGDQGRSWKPAAGASAPSHTMAWALDRLWSWDARDAEWRVEQSADRGKSWQRSETLTLGSQTMPYAFGADAQANLFAAGLVMTPNGPQQNIWLVRRSSDGGKSWSTVDRVPAVGAKGPEAEARAMDFSAGGAVYVAGTVGSGTWTVRSSRDSGTTWRTVDSVLVGRAGPRSVAVAPDGTVFVAGSLDVPAEANGSGERAPKWFVRASRDGQHWFTTDLFSDPRYQEYWAEKVVVTPKGDVLVFGRGMGTRDLGNRYSESFYAPAIVRRLSCGENPLPVVNEAPAGSAPSKQPPAP